METTLNLKTTTIDNLKDLVRINIDSAEGFEKAAELVDAPSYTDLFHDAAGRRRAHAHELRDLLAMNEEDAADSGSIKAQVHRWWMSLRGKVEQDSVRTMLIEAERGEDVIKGLYEDAIHETTGSAVNDVLHRQYREVKETHDRVRDLRDLVK